MAPKAKEKSKKKNTKDNSVLDLDHEIIIGIKTLPEPKVQKKKKTKPKNKSKTEPKAKPKPKTKPKTQKKRQPIQEQRKEQEKAKRKRRTIFRIIKWTTLLAILFGGGIYFMLSPYFNIKVIEVIGNEKITQDEIISLSEIKIDQNTFQIQNARVEEAIKQNAYVETVKVRRKLPDKIQIEITERVPTYMLTFANAYVYINNQGYLLEISKTALELPIITGYLTKEEDIEAGNRLCMEDLERLDDVLQIMKSAKSNGIGDLVTKINIADKQNYILELEKENKTVHLGDISNLSTKMLYIISILEENKEVEGEILVNTDLNNKGAIFRKKV